MIVESREEGLGTCDIKSCVHAKSLQWCLILCHSMDCSPPGFSVMGFSRQGYWSGFPSFSPGDLPHPGIEQKSPALQANSLSSEPPGKSMSLLVGQN